MNSVPVQAWPIDHAPGCNSDPVQCFGQFDATDTLGPSVRGVPDGLAHDHIGAACARCHKVGRTHWGVATGVYGCPRGPKADKISLELGGAVRSD